MSDYARAIARGGWPLLVNNPDADANQFLLSYVEDLARLDLKVSGVNRDPTRVRELLRAPARTVSTEANLAGLGREAGGEVPLHPRTVDN